LQRLLTLPDDVAVWPTHGAGSFCSAPPGADRTSTIGHEKATNSLLRAPDEDTFVRELVTLLGSFPPYFLRLANVNRRGPALLDGPPALVPLDPAEVRALLAAGGELLDVRPVPEFAAAHVPGSLSIPLRPVFATWLGWVAPNDRPLVVLRGANQSADEVAWQAAKIGYDFAGELAGGLAAWAAAGYPTTSTPVASADAVDGRSVLDVRQEDEFVAGHVPEAQHVELGELAVRIADVPAGPVVVMCGHGERAVTAASLLERAGRDDVAVLLGGPADWVASRGADLETGE
jgi:hydroxyacylglutathione hydrolase